MSTPAKKTAKKATKKAAKKGAKKAAKKTTAKNAEAVPTSVLEERPADATSQEIDAESKQKGKNRPKTKPLGTMVVDFWATSMHKRDIGIMKTTRYRAASRAFTKDFQINGAVKQDGQDIGFFGYRTAHWDETQITTRRLVLKFFHQDPSNENSVTHIGTIEWMTVPSVRASYAANVPLLEFRALIHTSPYLTIIKREETKITKIGEHFCIEVPVSDEEFQIIDFDEHRFTIGSDWYVRNQTEQVIAYIDEKKLNIGGKFDISLYDEAWMQNQTFITLLMLFTMTLKYHVELKQEVEDIIKRLKAGTMQLLPDADERELMLNPRKWGKRI